MLSAFALMGCSDDEKYDVDGSSDNIVYVNPSVSPTFKATIMRTQVGSFGYVGASVPVNIQRAASGNVQVSLTPDTSLVSEYNKQNNTECKAFPASVLSKLTVDAGSFSGGATTDTVTISAGDDTFGQFTESSYVLPLRLTTQGGDNVRPSTNHGVAYLVVNTTDVTLINDDANAITGTKAASHDGWSVSDCTNLNPDNFADLFGSGWSAGWEFNEKGSTAGFTLDLGKERSLAGFYLEGYVMKNCLVEVSTDKTNWVTVGNTSEHQAYSKYDPETWESTSEYVFYGAVKCRYIRFKFDLDANSWAWSYYNKVQGFSLYFND